MTEHSHDLLPDLAALAWEARGHARILGSTAVGCAVVGSSGRTWSGCNVEHKFRSHDIHAETNAIGTMISAGEQALAGLVVVAEREKFTPCGACLDWIWEFGGGDCFVGFQSRPGGEIVVLTAHELMPHYPR